jgi:hypothetical protein
MADEVSRKDIEIDMQPDPNLLLDRKWIALILLENCEEIVDLIRPLLKKSLGIQPLTEQEHALISFFEEEARFGIYTEDQKEAGAGPGRNT